MRNLASTESDDSPLGNIDLLVLCLYFIILGVISWVVSKHQSRINAEKESSATDNYFLAERSVGWWAVGASLFASNIGSEHFIGLAGSAAAEGIAVGWYEVGAIPVVILLGQFFLPTYLSAAVQTTPDYLEKRYSRFCRTVIVFVSMFLYIFTKISATLFAGQIILVEVVRVNKYLAVILLVSFTSLYTILGGLEAVIYTEALQTIVLFVGGFLVLGFSLHEVGGWHGLETQLDDLYNIDDNFMHFFRPVSDEDYPWTGFIFGYYAVAPWYWGVDQVIVQRTLAARDVAHGQLGCIMAASLKFLPFLMMVIPGVCGRVLVENRLGAEAAVSFDFDTIYPWLVLNVVPQNARGIIIAAMLSSLMSALASVFNSAATLIALNIWKVAYPETSEGNLVKVGRVSVVVLAVFSLLWLQVMPYLGSSLFLIIQAPPSYVGPPILVLYVWGMLSKIPSRRAGQWTLVIGIAVGSVRFVLEVLEDVAGQHLFGAFTGVNFLHYAAISFVACTCLLFALSYLLTDGAIYATMDVSDEPSSAELNSSIDNSLLFRWSLFYELMFRNKTHDSLEPITPNDLSQGTSGARGPTIYHERLVELTRMGSMESDSVADLTQVELSELALEDSASSSPGSGFKSVPLSRESESSISDNHGRLQRSDLSLDVDEIMPLQVGSQGLWISRKLILSLCLVVIVAWLAQVFRFF